MKWMLVWVLFSAALSAIAQSGKFREGYIIDRSGARYDGFLRIEPGTNAQPAKLFFREGKKGNTETYGPSYVRSFKIESDSFTIIKNITIPKQKLPQEDFVKVLVVGPGGVLYAYEYDVSKTSEHAASDFKTVEEKTRYLYNSKGKLVLISAQNFRDIGNIVSDCQDLKSKILNRKMKYADILKVVDEYKTCKSQSAKK